ncbi:MAG: BrnT family toxin [Chthoniobacterales bacterium]
MDGSFSGFERDRGNLAHCRKHGVSRAEIEGVFAGAVIILPDTGHSQNEKRFRAIGRTEGGRSVFVIFTIRETSWTPVYPARQRPLYAPRGD